MKLTFLGTAAAEGYPALWCRCERCTVARQRGGRNLRFRSSALVNDDLRLDIGPDVVAAAIRHEADLAPVQALLITHPHDDHLDRTNFSWRRKGFCPTALPLMHMDELARRDLLAPNARRIAHHFSHNGTPPCEELVALLSPQGIEPAYDGLVVAL